MTARATPYSRVLRHREYGGIALAQILSESGDQVAAIALSFFVYDRSQSAFFAALTYAVSHVPFVFGAILLSGLADRMPRRRLLLICDAARAVIAACLAIVAGDGTPLWVLFVLVLAMALFAPPFATARSALLPDIFGESEEYVSAVAIGRILQQLDGVVGFALGGIVVAAISPRGALALDAATFTLSFALIALLVRARPAVASAVATSAKGLRMIVADVREGARIVFTHPARRVLLLYAAAAVGFFIAPEGLAVAYAGQRGHGALAAGLLTAAMPLGIAIGAGLLVRFVPPLQQGRLLLPLGALAMVPLVATALVPPVWLAAVFWGLSGVCQCFLVSTIAAYNIVTDPAARGRANGLAAAAVAGTQALGYLVWGALGAWRGAAAGVAWAGVLGLAVIVVFRATWPREAVLSAWRRMAAAGAGTAELSGGSVTVGAPTGAANT